MASIAVLTLVPGLSAYASPAQARTHVCNICIRRIYK